MKNEIERKFLIDVLPDLSSLEKVEYERYFLFNQNGIEIRLQQKGSNYELERKVHISINERTREKLEITCDEFNELKKQSTTAIRRTSYKLSGNPEVSIKIYHGDYEGLIYAEVEFNSMADLKNFKKPDWLGDEITDTPLARDSKLIKLSRDEFVEQLDKLWPDRG